MADKKRVIVVGAGAAGFMAAITAARRGAKVTILEHMNFTARKIEYTGNGKCNFTNRNQGSSFYYDANTDLIENIFKEFSFDDTIDFFDGIGLVHKERNGYFYPISNQASAVSSLLKMEAEHLQIKIACNINIIKIEKAEQLFKVYTDNYIYEGQSLIIAAGSKAAPATGSDGSGYKLAKALGHHIDGPYPALVSLKCSGKEINTLSGLRNYGSVRLLIDGVQKAFDEGEIQFIKSGISGIPVFQVSRYASKILNAANENKKHTVTAVIDFLPMYTIQQLLQFFQQRLYNNSYKNLTAFLTGFLHEKIISVIAYKLGIKGNVNVDSFTDEQWNNICRALKNIEFNIKGTGDFTKAQVCCGGVLTDEVNEKLESRIIKDLFFAGEILDVDGKCGGYNLQWAWSSGFVAGKYASQK